MYIEQQSLLSQPQQNSDIELIHLWVQRQSSQKRRSGWQAINQFCAFVAKPLAQVTSADFQAFAIYLSEEQLPPQFCREMLLAVRSFLKFARHRGDLPAEMSNRRLRRRQLLQKALTMGTSQGKLLLAWCQNSRLPFQLQLALCAGFFFGLGWMMPRWLGLGLPMRSPQEEISQEWEEVAPVRSLRATSRGGSRLNNAKIRAFLDTIAIAEGTAGPQGYTTQFTGSQFSSFEDHPRQIKCGRGKAQRICSDAAGRYQLLSPTWDMLAKKIGAQDFRPTNQDRVAVELIRFRGALDDVEAGRFEVAVRKLARVWPSFKRLGGGSLEKSIPQLKTIYQQNLSRYASTVAFR